MCCWLTRRPLRTHLSICRKKLSGTGPNSCGIHRSCVAAPRFSCRHNAGHPLPYVKLTSLHTVLPHSAWAALTSWVISAAAPGGGWSPQDGSR